MFKDILILMKGIGKKKSGAGIPMKNFLKNVNNCPKDIV